jgi:mono/diheme cytochrome c family protein
VITRRVALILIAIMSVGYAHAGSDSAELVAQGEGWWRRSPDPRDPVACATCHHDRNATRGWAASFPKYRPLPEAQGRVMTLLQANAEAVRRHYGLADPRKPARAITAYLISRDAGISVSPGIIAGEPIFEARIRALDESVGRGEGLFARRCRTCHAPTAIAGASMLSARTADGRVESLEEFLEHHDPGRPRLSWDGQPTADIIAFLMSRLTGRLVSGFAVTPK